MSVPLVRGYKAGPQAPPLVMVTAYDAPGARIADGAGVDMILVGDSLAMVVLGYENTLQVTISDMAHHTAAVARVRPRALVVADMPWMSYHTTPADTLANAACLIRAGAVAVKLEGGRRRLDMVAALVGAEIPVMGHLGLTPQSVNTMGGYRVQARQVEAIEELMADAAALEAAGVFAIVLEGVPDVVAATVTSSLGIPTIGIGAGRGCDGQVLVFHDVLGLEERIVAKFVRRYADLAGTATEALASFAADVRAGRFPTDAESYHLADDVALALYSAGVAPAARLSDPPKGRTA
ncbi:MAG: 3-methyl-2-oxobutanoate hydroxymethyltransferase [Acidimicrobiales bacterium]